MRDDKYRVIYKGEIVDGETIDNVKKNLAGLFKCDVEKIELLCSGKPRIVLQDRDLQSCQKIKQLFLKSGAICNIETEEKELDLNIDEVETVSQDKDKKDFIKKIELNSKKNTKNHFLGRLLVLYQNYDVLNEFRAFILYFSFFSSSVMFSFDTSSIEFSSVDKSLLFIPFIFSPFLLYLCIKMKDYVGIIAIMPTLNWFFVTMSYTSETMLYIMFFILPLVSFFYIFITGGFRYYTFILAMLIYFISLFSFYMGLQFFILFLFQSILIILFLSFILYAIYRSFIDNKELWQIFGKVKFYNLIIKTLLLWCPLLIFIIPGFWMSSVVDKTIVMINEKIISIGTSIEPVKPLFEEVNCGFNPICYINPLNMVKKQVNHQYMKANLPDKAKQGTLFISEIVKAFLEIFSLLSYITLWFLVIRSYLYVFSRVAISLKHNLPATLANIENNSMQSNLSKGVNEYTISIKETKKLYIHRRYEPIGYPPKVSFPYPTKSIIGRIIGNAYIMNEVILKEERPVCLSTTGGSEFIEWDLKDNEEIVFSYKHFVAMSDSVRLHTIISFKLTSMILGKVFHCCAQGPGKVIFSACGKAKSFKDGTQSESIPINRIIAWNRNVKFDVESELNHLDIFLSGIYLKPSSVDALIIDADEQNKPDTGLVQFVKKFLLPL